MNTSLSRYHDEGYAVVPGLLSLDEVDAIHREITSIIENRNDYADELIQIEPLVRSGDRSPESFELGVRKLFRVGKHNDFFRDFAIHERLVEVARELLGPDLFLLQSMTLMKPPHVSTRKLWHQDNAYFRLDPPDVLGIWIAGDEATVENGCMHIVPGSHRLGIVEHAGEGDEYGIVTPPADDCVLPVPLSPGDALVFHGELQHFTPENTTTCRRRSIQYHYASSHSKWTGTPDKAAYFEPEVHICGAARSF